MIFILVALGVYALIWLAAIRHGNAKRKAKGLTDADDISPISAAIVAGGVYAAGKYLQNKQIEEVMKSK